MKKNVGHSKHWKKYANVHKKKIKNLNELNIITWSIMCALNLYYTKKTTVWFKYFGFQFIFV